MRAVRGTTIGPGWRTSSSKESEHGCRGPFKEPFRGYRIILGLHWATFWNMYVGLCWLSFFLRVGVGGRSHSNFSGFYCRVDGRRIPYSSYIMGPTKHLIQDPCPSGVPIF